MLEIFLAHVLIYWTSAFYWDHRNKISPILTVLHTKRVLANQLCVILPMLLSISSYSSEQHLPSSSFCRILLSLLIGEFTVLIVHFALHKVTCLRSFHALHHAPLTSAAQTLDSSFVEVLFMNVLAPFFPFIMLDCPMWSLKLAILAGTAHAVATHSQDLRFVGIAYDHHQKHHHNPKTNFATFGFADWVIGTH